MNITSKEFKNLTLNEKIIDAQSLVDQLSDVNIDNNGVSLKNLSADYLYADDSNIQDIIREYQVKSDSRLYIGITTTDTSKTFKCKMPIFNYDDDGIRYFVNWGDSEEDQEITPYTEAMEISHEYSAAGEFTI